jgi:hypothetical protein
MSGNALENAGTIASGGTLVIGSLAWIEVNSTALSILIMAFTALMTCCFYVASLKLKKLEIMDKAKDELIDDFYQKISETESSSKEIAAAKTMLKDIMNRRDNA